MNTCPNTYAASCHRKPFDWHAFLRRKTYTEASLRAANDRAGEWVTCACGNQCKVIPRLDDGEPIDDVLSDLGMTFYHWIGQMVAEDGITLKDARREALTTLTRIERRAQVLIRQVEKARS